MKARELHSTLTADGTIRLTIDEVDVGETLGADEVIVRVDAAPINPTDLFLLLSGADLSRATASGDGVVAPVHADIVSAFAGRIDEPLTVGSEGAGTDTSEFVKQCFGDFRGYLQSDASNVYDVLERGRPADLEEADGVRLVGCFAHLRRYLFEAAICRYPVGLQGLLRIRAIYAADQAGQHLPPTERTEFRAQHVRPLVEEFLAWARAARATTPGRNLATKALGYALNQEAELLRVLDDGNLPLDNTRAERALRKIVVGRKNWMFYGSDTHAEAAAAIFSVIAST